MGLRERNGKWEWRFKVNGHEYSEVTDLAATKRNETKARQREAEARRLVLEGRQDELRLQVVPVVSAIEQFNEWARGEYSAHPNSAIRLRSSLVSVGEFFSRRPLASLTQGDLEDYKSWRRSTHQVREITLRHDLHALSLLFQYGQKHNWCRRNLVRLVEIPSDADATREHVLTADEERRLFDAFDALAAENPRRLRGLRGLQGLRDISSLMLSQGCRPEELRALKQADVSLAGGTFMITGGKSKAAKRTLPMTPAARWIFEERLSQPGLWVFPGRWPSRHLDESPRLWAKVIERAGIAAVLYDLRHTFATRAIERGVELPRLMAILGHANLRSIMRYVHMRQGDIDEGMRKLGQADLAARFRPADGPPKGGPDKETQGNPGNSGPGLVN